ncbi:MAG: hypothetical protein IKO14_08045 [Oscillibacter sp.]|nr:hypothetical protein [Oscillibacter sp.]
MVKTMKRGLSLMFVLSLLVSMLVIPAKAADKKATVGYGHTWEDVTIHTNKSFLGLQKTKVEVKNTSSTRTITLYQNNAVLGDIRPGKSKSLSLKANGKAHTLSVQSASGSGSATVNFTIKNGY